MDGVAYAFLRSLVGRLNLGQLECELKKRWLYPNIWYRKQNDAWDQRSDFIYDFWQFESVLERISRTETSEFDKQGFLNYALNRWYNYWSARAVEQIFCEQPGVVPAKNAKDRLVDFSINGINFDLKTSVFPKAFDQDLAFAKANPAQLINWLYTHQSTGRRFHLENRLFLIVHQADGRHYRLKAEISWLQGLIADYVSTFDASKLVTVSTTDSKTVFSDSIWAVR
ncbi:hypothetical protein [Leeuwenhoekiella sp. H156]|uniref:hypothetical protein n=1 Tax=Leeuwenhoekiella sp. H156 TaxID=3450128 RepID=UPI003FA44BF1